MKSDITLCGILLKDIEKFDKYPFPRHIFDQNVIEYEIYELAWIKTKKHGFFGADKKNTNYEVLAVIGYSEDKSNKPAELYVAPFANIYFSQSEKKLVVTDGKAIKLDDILKYVPNR